ncbi:MAG: hypothetical protein ETSY2_45555 [Candidatus Entotheonella gemina]|uniref:Tail sheath protein C-terminal domain-containing protein n=1 Tax=Candidatus Entotheonella gemina TaxID=1429439 RepID=W4LFZ8_9BACT|nr:MAG: hypothetical protein ETSY2_45555 [Candidatus Entotheonella gemina]
MLATPVTASDQAQLNPYGVDAIRHLPNAGICVWGARTLSLDPLWQYVNVRRLMIFIEQSIKQSLHWAVFQPNGQKLWSEISREISSFLTAQWRDGALVGKTSAEAFYVKVDASNNPPESMAQGYLHVDMGVAPIRPAEFVVIRVAQLMEVSKAA